MNPQILDIYEITNGRFKMSGIVTPYNYVRVFCLNVRYPDEIIGNLYFGYRKNSSYANYLLDIQVKTLERYDLELSKRIESFGMKYMNEMINGTSFEQIISMDTEDILNLNRNQKLDFFVKKLIKSLKKKKET